MALGGNSSEERVVGRALYTGLLDMHIEAINPTKEQMEQMGMSPQKDPIYTTDDKDDAGNEYKKTRLDFYLKRELDSGKIVRAKLAIFIGDKERVSQTGKKQVVNAFGRTTWTDTDGNLPEYQWFKKDDARVAFEGEEMLTSFLKAFLNVKVDEDPCQIDDISAIANGNVSELIAVKDSYPDNQVKVLLGVDGEYQTVYQHYFGRPYDKNLNAWRKALEGQYSAFKGGGGRLADYQDNLMFQEYTGSSVMVADMPDTGTGQPVGDGTTLSF